MDLAKQEEFDPVLLPFVTASDETQAESELSKLLCQQEITITQIVGTKLRVSLSTADASHLNQEALDVISEVKAALITSLWSLKTSPFSRPISDFRAYVATVTFNACSQMLSTSTGKVELLDRAVSLASSNLKNGVATFNISSLGVGAHFITAQYNPSRNFLGSTSVPLAQQIIKTDDGSVGVVVKR